MNSWMTLSVFTFFTASPLKTCLSGIFLPSKCSVGQKVSLSSHICFGLENERSAVPQDGGDIVFSLALTHITEKVKSVVKKTRRGRLGVFKIENIASIDISINIGKLILKVDIEGR